MFMRLVEFDQILDLFQTNEDG